MTNTIIDNFMPPGPSRGQTRGCEDFLNDRGKSLVKKLPCQLLNVNKIKNNLKKYSKCSDRRCKCCPLAGKEQIEEGKSIFCKASNIIYYFECHFCNLGYVGQTVTCLNIRINGHRSDITKRKNKNANDIEIKHFQSHSFDKIKLYIIDIVPDLDSRLKAENLYICKLNTIYPYGLNSMFNGTNCCSNKNFCVYNTFNLTKPNLVTKRGGRGKGKNKNKIDIVNLMKNINLKDLHLDNIKTIKSSIFSLKNKAIVWFLKNKLADFNFINSQIKDIVLDLFKCKLKCDNLDIFLKKHNKNIDKPIENLVITFSNKTFNFINFNEILNNCLNYFPLIKECKIRTAFSYSKPLKSLICNYNFFSKNIDAIKDVDCLCNNSKYTSYVNPNYGHILTGNLNIIEDENLRHIMGLGSKFRLDINYNYNKIFDSFEKDIDTFLLKISYKYVWPLQDFLIWKRNICKLFKIKYLFSFKHLMRNKNHYNLTKLFNSIKILKDKFIVSTVDKADNNFCIICKSFYKKLLLEEYIVNNTYRKLTSPLSVIKDRLNAFTKKLNFRIPNHKFPYLFITAKFHKNPVKFRFITCATNSYNANANKIFFNFLNKILKVIETNKSGYIIVNNNPVIDYINSNNSKITSINTFDFENLFGSIPHSDIIKISNAIFDEFSSVLNCEKNYWINLVKFCIFENIIFNGKNYFLQVTGIPMGTSYSSAFANIFLYFYEKNFNSLNIKFLRYIDDIIVFNCENFLEVSSAAYPKELKLKHTNYENYIAFLDLKIKMDKNVWQIGIYDKRKDFNFKVNNLTNWHSCISNKVLKNILFSQLVRFKRICNNPDSLNSAICTLINTATYNGYPLKILNNIS